MKTDNIYNTCSSSTSGSSFYLLSICLTIIFTQYIGYYTFKITAKDINTYFFNNTITFNLLFSILFFCTLIAKTISGLLFGILGDLLGLKRTIQIPIILTIFSLGLLSITPSYSEIGNIASIAYILANILFQISLAGEMQNIRLYITSFIHGYTGEALALLPKYCAVLMIIVTQQYISYYKIPFQHIFYILFFISCMTIFLRNNIPATQINSNQSTSVNSILQNTYKNISKNKYYSISQILLYGVTGGLLYFYCVFLKLFLTNQIQLITTQYNISYYIMISITLGTLFSITLEKRISLYRHILICVILKIITTYITTLQLQNIALLIVFLSINSFILGALATPILTLLRATLPSNNKCTFTNLVKNTGSILISNTTINICFILYNYSQNASTPFFFSIFLLLIIIPTSYYLNTIYIQIQKLKYHQQHNTCKKQQHII